jgi:hypothetical protein
LVGKVVCGHYRARRARGVAQVEECLLCKHKALSSKKKKKSKKKEKKSNTDYYTIWR